MKNLHESFVDFLQHPYIYLDYCFFFLRFFSLVVSFYRHLKQMTEMRGIEDTSLKS